MKKEEMFSFWSHFAGFVFASIGTIYLIFLSNSFALRFLVVIYGLSASTLFLASSLYHFHKKNNEEISIWRKLDHIAIFFMIAGTYTPIAYIYLQGYWKWIIIISQWVLVLGGLFFKLFYLKAPRYIYTIIYILMGWMGIFPITKFINTMSGSALFFLFAGGISYTVGAVFYILKKPQFNKYFGFHEIFHLLILIGAFSHFMLVKTAILSI